MFPAYCTPRQAGVLLGGMSASSVKRLVAAGQLAGHRNGPGPRCHWRIHLRDLVRLAHERGLDEPALVGKFVSWADQVAALWDLLRPTTRD